MAQDDKDPKVGAVEKMTDATRPARPAAMGPPIVVENDKKSKRKRKYSRGLRTVQDVERGISRSAETLSKAMVRTFSEYRKRSKKSSGKKRDGAIRDGIENWTKAMSKGMRVAADAPYKLAKSVNRGKLGKQVRDAVRLATPPILR